MPSLYQSLEEVLHTFIAANESTQSSQSMQVPFPASSRNAQYCRINFSNFSFLFIRKQRAHCSLSLRLSVVAIMPEIITDQQQKQDVADNEEENKEPTMSKSVVGIIYPPPEVRSIR